MKKKTDGFLERTVLSVVTLVQDTMDSERFAAAGGFLQRRDPRIKIASAMLVLFAVLLSNSVLPIAALYCVCLFLVAFSRIGIGYFLKRTLPFIPLFSLFIALPAVFDFITPGTPIVAFKVHTLAIAVTREGVDTALLFLVRVLASVSFAVLLVLTTRHHALLKTLRIFRVPRLFVMTMGMSYRYIFLLLDIIRNTFTAIKSRVGFVDSAKNGRRVVSAGMAGLWLRSYRLHAQVYDAMVSRGYAGESVTIHRFRVTMADGALALAAFTLLMGSLWLNRFFP